MEVKTTNKVTGVIIHSETWLLAPELWLLVLMQPIEQLLVSQQPAQLILGLQAPCPCPALCQVHLLFRDGFVREADSCLHANPSVASV